VTGEPLACETEGDGCRASRAAALAPASRPFARAAAGGLEVNWHGWSKAAGSGPWALLDLWYSLAHRSDGPRRRQRVRWRPLVLPRYASVHRSLDHYFQVTLRRPGQRHRRQSGGPL